MRQDNDIMKILKEWPDLVPDTKIMDYTARLMDSHIATVRSITKNDLNMYQFRVLSIGWAGIAFMLYLIWPYAVDFFSQYPLWTAVLICIAGLSICAPLILLLLPKGEYSDCITYKTNGGTQIC